MRKISVFIFILGIMILSSAAACAEERVTSPDGNTTAVLSEENGTLTYTVYSGGNEIIRAQGLGIRLSDVDFTSGVSIASRSDNTINETYEMVTGKEKTYTNKANESVFTITKDGEEMQLYIRAYDDGAAYRYGLNRDAQAVSENTVFTFGSSTSDVWAMEYEKCYEQFYNRNTLTGLSGIYGMPMTAKINDYQYAMLAEAELNGSYAGSVLRADGSGRLYLEFEPKQQENVVISSPFLSPWRAIAVGGLDDIVQTELIENLCAPSKIEDTSWIEPGVSSWTWFNGDPTNDPEIYKQYIDFSAEMGWKYVLLDEGWQSGTVDEYGRKTYSGIESWTQDVIDYASSKGIGVIVWSTYWDLDTLEKRERLKEWASMGIKGVKIDFFDSETQPMLQLYDEITRETAELHLLVNYHGCNKPTGERRTWPHLVTREGVYGNEHFQSGGDWGPTAEHNCTLPFTRNVVGPMDYTPAISNYNGKNYFSNAHKAALPIIFESGIQCFSDKPDIYRQSVLYNYFKYFPTVWDETKLISGSIGERVVIMRRSGDTYYIGSICNAQTEQDIELDFLPDGQKYAMEVYSDGANDTEVVYSLETVDKNSIITLRQLNHGGAAIKIYPIWGSIINDISGHWSEGLVRELESSGRLNGYFCGNFMPDEKITRGEFVMMLCTAMGVDVSVKTPVFGDSVNSRAKNYIAAAVDLGIINGMTDTEFAPDEPITREQAAAVIGRALDLAGGINLGFADRNEISDYAKMYVSVCAEKGIIEGYDDGTFRPLNNITRAETAAILSRCVSGEAE